MPLEISAKICFCNMSELILYHVNPFSCHQIWAEIECYYTHAAGRSITVHRLSHPPTHNLTSP